jgi:myo-inositol 2-dehydrogenase / D-chiro-inositol 1-dehydrogenase
MTAFVAACRGEQALPLSLRDATEATRICQALRESLASGLPVNL